MELNRRTARIALALGALGLAGFSVMRLARPNRVVVANLSEGDVRQVTLTLNPLDDGEPISRSYASIAVGESKCVEHAFNDVSAVLEFIDVGGNARRLEAPDIDLWSGQGWSFTIRSDGVTEQGYDD